MKRRFAGRSGSLTATAQGEQGFWPSYADMMSAVALILFFLMLISYIQNLITGNNLENTKEQLEDMRVRLSSTQLNLKNTEDRLSRTQSSLSDTQIALTETELSLSDTLRAVADAQSQLDLITGELDSARLTLTQQQDELSAQEALLASREAMLAEQAELIAQQQAFVDTANEELQTMRGQMQAISVLRLSILNQICDSFVQATGDPSKVSVADNGSIVLSSSILFKSDKYEIQKEAEPALRQLANIFYQFLSDSENVKYVDSIVISGHTDSTDTAAYNRELSTNRANAVLSFLLECNGGRLNQFDEYFCAAGYGETRPIADNNTEIGKQANRRIEISITLKDDTILDVVEYYLNLDVPEGVSVSVNP